MRRRNQFYQDQQFTEQKRKSPNEENTERNELYVSILQSNTEMNAQFSKYLSNSQDYQIIQPSINPCHQILHSSQQFLYQQKADILQRLIQVSQSEYFRNVDVSKPNEKSKNQNPRFEDIQPPQSYQISQSYQSEVLSSYHPSQQQQYIDEALKQRKAEYNKKIKNFNSNTCPYIIQCLQQKHVQSKLLDKIIKQKSYNLKSIQLIFRQKCLHRQLSEIFLQRSLNKLYLCSKSNRRSVFKYLKELRKLKLRFIKIAQNYY